MFGKDPFTRLTVETSDGKIIWEVPYEDVTGEDMLNALNTLMIGMTFAQETVYHAMADWLNDHANDLYEVVDKIDYEDPDYVEYDGSLDEKEPENKYIDEGSDDDSDDCKKRYFDDSYNNEFHPKDPFFHRPINKN